MSGIRTAGNVLDRIVAARREDVAARKAVTPLAEVRARAESAGPVLPFTQALKRSVAGRPLGDSYQGPLHSGEAPGRGHTGLIAEMKRASPSGGALRSDLDPAKTAITYASSGAAAISVLTEARYFQGSLRDLALAKAAVAAYATPLLEKDFLFDEYQVYEARAHGADAVLLIAAILDREGLKQLHHLASELGMAALVEVFDESELEVALEIKPQILGINNRNLKTLQTSLSVFERLAPLVPAGTTLVAESGMKGPDDVRRMRDAGAHAVLVGEALMRAGGGVAELVRAISGNTDA